MYFSMNALPALYDKLKNEVVQDLMSDTHDFLTSERWTSRDTVTSSHVDYKWEI